MKRYYVKSSNNIKRKSKIQSASVTLDFDEDELILDPWIEVMQEDEEYGTYLDKNGNPIDWDDVTIEVTDCDEYDGCLAVDYNIMYSDGGSAKGFAVLVPDEDGDFELDVDGGGNEDPMYEDLGWTWNPD